MYPYNPYGPMYGNQMYGNPWGSPFMMNPRMMPAMPTSFPSMVDKLKDKKPYELNAPNLAQLFPNMQNPSAYSFQNSMPQTTPQNSSGAGRFVGLLGGAK